MGAAAFEKNFYVRWRHFLWPKWQVACVFLTILAIGVGNILVLALFPQEAALPCLNEPIINNPLVLGMVIVSWVHFVPLVVTSIWSTRKLKKYPKDNWKMGAESTLTSLLALSHGLFSVIVLATNPYLDSILFFFLVYCVPLQVLNFYVPLVLHRKTIAQLAELDVRHLAPLSRLLKDPTFFSAFEAFLRTEFSSETVAFWKDVEIIKGKYRALLPVHMLEVSSGTSQQSSRRGDTPPMTASEEELTQQAAEECVETGKRYIGDSATWQVNISSGAAHAVLEAVGELSKLKDSSNNNNVMAERRTWVEELLKALVTAQAEVYETLTRDSYPRFLLSPACKTITDNTDLKKLLAAEKLEQEAQEAAPSTTSKNTTNNNNNNHNNNNGSSHGGERGGSEISQDASRKRSGADQSNKSNKFFRFQSKGQSVQLDVNHSRAPTEDSEPEESLGPRNHTSSESPAVGRDSSTTSTSTRPSSP